MLDHNYGTMDSDKFEYIYPNYNFTKDLNEKNNINGNLIFNSSGFQKLYNTNTNEKEIIKAKSNHYWYENL